MKIPGRSFKSLFSKAKQGATDSKYLKGKLLLSMPQMHDPRFERAVIYICGHDDGGAMGLMINQEATHVSLEHLCEQMDFEFEDGDTRFPIYGGGPVDGHRGFILHTPDFKMNETVSVNKEYALTGTVDALKLIIKEKIKPEHMIFALGYTGWSAGQLEDELSRNAWLVAPSSSELVFKTPRMKLWTRAMESLGVDPAMLSGDAGTA